MFTENGETKCNHCPNTICTNKPYGRLLVFMRGDVHEGELRAESHEEPIEECPILLEYIKTIEN